MAEFHTDNNRKLGLILSGIVVAEYGGPVNIAGKEDSKVVVTVEIAFAGGLAFWTRFIDLKDCPHFLDPDEFIDIPRIGLLKSVKLKLEQMEVRHGIMKIREAKIVS